MFFATSSDFMVCNKGPSFDTTIFKIPGRICRMDIISQLQEQVNTVAALAFNTFGTLQRDAPPVRLSPNYPEPPANPNPTEDAANLSEQPKLMSASLVKAAKQVLNFSTKLES